MSEGTLNLTIEAARAVHLAAQGLSAPPKRAARKADVLTAIRRMGALQIDTISVIARSPYFVLWSRLGQYDPHWLEELHAEGALFEYWSHAACFLPIEDYWLYRRVMLDHRDGSGYLHDYCERNREMLARVVATVRERGAVRSAEFEREAGSKSGWWSWKPEKHALEHLLNIGDLMVPRREGFQRVYDLRERVLPDWDDTRAASRDEARRTLAVRAVRALGVATPQWAKAYYKFPLHKVDVAPILAAAAAEGELVPVDLESVRQPAYVHRDMLPLLERAGRGLLRCTHTTLLSPFDPVVRDRARALTLFGFAYLIETYTPAEKRKYGYFSLPILHRGALIGRLDAKAHRRTGEFEVKSLHLDSGTPATSALAADLARVLLNCAAWHRTPRVLVRAADPSEFRHLLESALSEACAASHSTTG